MVAIGIIGRLRLSHSNHRARTLHCETFNRIFIWTIFFKICKAECSKISRCIKVEEE